MEKKSTVVRLFTRAFVCRSLNAIAFIALVSLLSYAQQYPTISGVVFDTSGATIQGANVELRINEHVSSTHTDDEGRFVIGLRSSEQSTTAVALVVSAYGFATRRVALSLLDHPNSIEVRLEPAPLTARIEIEANDQTNAIDGETVVSDAQIARSAAVTIDDALRQVPGFSLFRRSGSLTANPTSQGLSLRGVGASGASRAVVLLDGVPLNSPL